MLHFVNGAHPPALILMDMELSGCDQKFWDMLLNRPRAPIVVLHTFGEENIPKALLGKVARVPKDGNIEALIRAVGWCLERLAGRYVHRDNTFKTTDFSS
nr:response regulator transcription factor [Desulfovibrio inopinatus]